MDPFLKLAKSAKNAKRSRLYAFCAQDGGNVGLFMTVFDYFQKSPIIW
jgi:hypothetical protein